MKKRYLGLLNELRKQLMEDEKVLASVAAGILLTPKLEVTSNKGLQVVLGYMCRRLKELPLSTDDNLRDIAPHFVVGTPRYYPTAGRLYDSHYSFEKRAYSSWASTWSETYPQIEVNGEVIQVRSKVTPITRSIEAITQEIKEVQRGFWALGNGWVSLYTKGGKFRNVPSTWTVYGQDPQACPWILDGFQTIPKGTVESIDLEGAPRQLSLHDVFAHGLLVGEKCLVYQTEDARLLA
jgi:hypothetical protein